MAQLRDSILGKLSELFAPLLEIRDNIIQGFLDMVHGIIELPGLIQDKIKELFESFFVPDEELMNERLAQLRSRFAFIDSLAGYGEHILNFLQNASGKKAPSFTIDLSKKTGQFSWGSQVIVVDFAWYAPYKPIVDNVVAGIIWITWLWHMYKRLPEIIHGQGMTTERIIDISTRKD